jgi:hypothetical protein
MILPVGAKSFQEAMKMGTEVYHTLKGLIKAKYGQDACNVGDEGGFAPNISSGEDGLELIATAIEATGYTGRVRQGDDEWGLHRKGELWKSVIRDRAHSGRHFSPNPTSPLLRLRLGPMWRPLSSSARIGHTIWTSRSNPTMARGRKLEPRCWTCTATMSRSMASSSSRTPLSR